MRLDARSVDAILDILFGALLDKMDARLDVHNQKQVDLVLRLIMGHMVSLRMVKYLSMLLEPQKIIIVIKMHLKASGLLKLGMEGRVKLLGLLETTTWVFGVCLWTGLRVRSR